MSIRTAITGSRSQLLAREPFDYDRRKPTQAEREDRFLTRIRCVHKLDLILCTQGCQQVSE